MQTSGAIFWGCNIVPQSDQSGLLEIVRKIIDSQGIADRQSPELPTIDNHELLLSVLRDADKNWIKHMFVALSDPETYKFFVRS